MSLLMKENKFKVKVNSSLSSDEFDHTDGFKTVEIWDASEEYLPDFTPDWLYSLLDSLPGEYGELMESIFECDDEFLEALKNHPNCVEYKEG